MNQRWADFFNLTFGFRKFIAWLALFLTGLVLLERGQLNGSQFVDLIKATFLGFVAGNGVEHLVSVVKEYVNAQGQPTASAPAPKQADDDIVEGDGK